MRYCSQWTILSKLIFRLFLEEVELEWQSGLVDLVGLLLKEEFDSFDSDEPWALLGPKISFNGLGDGESSSKYGEIVSTWADSKHDEQISEGRWSNSFLKARREEESEFTKWFLSAFLVDSNLDGMRLFKSLCVNVDLEWRLSSSRIDSMKS